MNKKGMSEDVEPIKSIPKIRKLQNELKRHKNGEEILAIFNLSMGLLLRISDVVKLKKNEVFDKNGNIKNDVKTRDIKTNKIHYLNFDYCKSSLILYNHWLNTKDIHSKWLFPAITNTEKHINKNYYYNYLKRISEYIGLKHVGTHSGRKTGAYFIYKHSNNLALVMKMLNQSSLSSTLHYLGLTDKLQGNQLKWWSEYRNE